MECNYKKNSVEPCKTCPRKITALYMCKLLQETAELAQKDLKESRALYWQKVKQEINNC